MTPWILMVILTLFVFYCIKYMIKRGDDLHAFSFLILYIYTIFAQIGYVYYPILSMGIGAYFGPALYYRYWAFMFLSFVTAFFIYRMFPLKKTVIYEVYRVKYRKEFRFYFGLIFLFICLLIYFYKNRSLFSWGSGNPMGSSWFSLLFYFFTISTIVLYAVIRYYRSSKFKILLLICCVTFFIQVASAAGIRSSILYFFIAIASIELSPFIVSLRNRKTTILKFVVLGCLLVYGLLIILQLRTQGSISLKKVFQTDLNAGSNALPISEQILLQDYYAPSHTLFVSMYYDMIDPVEVIKSNVCNAILGVHYPPLTNTIVARVKGETLERGVGWSYHFFVQGYNFMGFMGFLYNGILWNILLRIWFLFVRTDNVLFRRTMYALLIFCATLAMRNQTAQFIRSIYLNFIPGMICLIWATNSRIRFRKNAHWDNLLNH